MHTFKVLIALFILILSASTKTFAQTSLSHNAGISLLTCGPGNELYSVFGHTAIRVQDPASGFDVVYNFGSFDFDTPNFYPKFAKGDLQYYVTASSYEDFIYTYVYYNRDIYEQALNLSISEKQNIADELNSIMLSDKRFYTYKFIHRNCTTMVADIINKHIEGSISLEISNKGKTYREILLESLDGHYYENLGINLLFGARTDMISQKLFLPAELMEGVGVTSIQAGSLAKSTIAINKSSEEEKFSVWNNIYTFIAICLVLIFLSDKQLMQRSFAAIFGLLGVFLLFIGLYSSHPELGLNYNILLANPLFLLLLYFMFNNKVKGVLTVSYIIIAFSVIYLVLMINKPHLFIVWPLITLTIVVLIRITLATKKKLG